MSKKKIPCKVCGKMFEPCCMQYVPGSNALNWRSFACSPKCAEEYVQRAIAYREKARKEREFAEAEEQQSEEVPTEQLEESVETTAEIETETETKKKARKQKKTS